MIVGSALEPCCVTLRPRVFQDKLMVYPLCPRRGKITLLTCTIESSAFPICQARGMPGETDHSTACKIECTLSCMTTALYLRVSSPKGQKTDSQRAELEAW